MTQEQAFTLMTLGKNIFLTGEPGAGKTYVAQAYINYLRRHEVKFAVTGSTGIAASHLDGQTIHSFSGIGIRKFLSEQARDELIQKEYLHKRFDGLRVLFIDEVSMLSDGYLDMVDMVLRDFCDAYLPFGGVQIILVGDFFQLPPIEGNFAFQAKSWKEGEITTCYLEGSHRHKDDMNLQNILSAIRNDNQEEKEYAQSVLDSVLLENKELSGEVSQNITRLYTHNMDVDYVNGERLSELSGNIETYEMSSKGKSSAVTSLKKSCLAQEELQLKKEALVMFVKNNPQLGYVNGTIGTVIDVDGMYPKVELKNGRVITVEPEVWRREDNGKVIAEISQIPLRLAWAITVHKSQGMTLDAALIDLSKTFVPGQGYVALSRVKNINGLYLNGYNDQALEVSSVVKQYDQLFKKESQTNIKRLEITEQERLDNMAETFVPAMPGTKNYRTFKECSGDKIALPDMKIKEKISTYDQTLALILQKTNFEDIVEMRDLSESTILNHVEKLLLLKKVESGDVEYLKKELFKKYEIAQDEFDEIETAFENFGKEKLKPIYESFEGEYSYDVIKFVKAFSSQE